MPPGLEKLLEKYNNQLDAAVLLEELSLSHKKDKKNSKILVSACPLHDDADNRSLRVDTRTNTFVCKSADCEAHKGGNLITLFSLARNVSYQDASLEIFNVLGLKKNENTRIIKRNLYIAFSEKLTAENLLQAAKNLLLSAFREFPENLVIISRLINIYTREKDKDMACQYLIKAARIVAKNKNYNSAKTALKRVFSFNPENQEAKELLADIFVAECEDFYHSSKAPDGEEKFIDSLTDLSLTPSLRVQFIQILLKYRRLEMLRKLYSDLPDDLDEDQKNHLQKVAELLEKKIPEYDNPVDLFLFLADTFLKLGEHESLKQTLHRAQNAVEKGLSPERKDEVENRLRNFEDILIKKEYDHAQALLKAGNYQQALEKLSKALNAGRLTTELAKTMIHCCFKLDRIEQAHKLCLSLSDLYKKKENQYQAALALYHGLLFQPGHQDTIVRLIEIFKLLGDNDTAEQVAELADRQVSIPHEPVPDKKQTPPPKKPEPKTLPKPVPETKPSPKLIEIQLPLRLNLYTSGTSTDHITPIDALTISLDFDSLVVNCGNIKIPGIQPASINYVLQNCQVMGNLSLPDKKDPIKVFGKIIKVQNRRISKEFHKIVIIELVESEDPDRTTYRNFILKISKGDYIVPEESMPPPPVSPKPPKKTESKLQELMVSVRFLDESGEEKCPDFFYANTRNVQEQKIILDFGELEIPGVRAPSQNFFLENSVFEMTIPLPEQNDTIRLMGEAKKVKNKMISGRRCKVVEVEFTESPERDRQIFQDYIQSFPSI